MKKKVIPTIREKNRIIDNIINAMVNRDSFLILGHQNSDEDCIASTVAFGLLLSKFLKDTKICLGRKVHDHFQYLINICRYNSIQVFDRCEKLDERIDTIVICDTPKPSMVEKSKTIQALFNDKAVLKIEIDHHIGADSQYIGDEGYCLVTEATSASELIGHLTLKLQKKRALLEQYMIENPFSRNLVLAILSGIIGDTNMGQFLKSRREKRYYRLFTAMLNEMLSRETIKETNFSNIDEVYQELQRLSTREDSCFNYFKRRKQFSSSFGYVALNEDESEYLNKTYDDDTIVSVARAIANELAEESTMISLVSYYDNPDTSDLIQFRVRRSKDYKKYDLRKMLDLFSIKNGGGHEGAIGFRIPKNRIDNFDSYVQHLITGLESVIPG